VVIFHDENDFARLRDIFTIFGVTCQLRQVHLEMSAIVADADDAKIIFGRNAAVCTRGLGIEPKNKCRKETERNSVEKHGTYSIEG
jgi:hypothetical protein